MKVHVLGIDLAKNVFQLHGVDRKGRPLLVRRVRREHLLGTLGELAPCLIGLEASTGAFYWQRQFEKLGHTVKIMAQQYVKPFVRNLDVSVTEGKSPVVDEFLQVISPGSSHTVGPS